MWILSTTEDSKIIIIENSQRLWMEESPWFQVHRTYIQQWRYDHGRYLELRERNTLHDFLETSSCSRGGLDLLEFSKQREWVNVAIRFKCIPPDASALLPQLIFLSHKMCISSSVLARISNRCINDLL